tara:strand:- start:32 stop:298 length:267 start_codon:yes stop_codon:yes gene_type:complete
VLPGQGNEFSEEKIEGDIAPTGHQQVQVLLGQPGLNINPDITAECGCGWDTCRQQERFSLQFSLLAEQVADLADQPGKNIGLLGAGRS